MGYSMTLLIGILGTEVLLFFFVFFVAIPPDRGSLLRGHSLRAVRATIPAGYRNTGRPL